VQTSADLSILIEFRKRVNLGNDVRLERSDRNTRVLVNVTRSRIVIGRNFNF